MKARPYRRRATPPDRHGDALRVDINTTPLVDVLLVLLIVLLIALPTAPHALKLTAPESARAAKAPPGSAPRVVLDIDADGQRRWGGEKLGPRGAEADSALRQRLRDLAAQPGLTELALRPHPDVDYGQVTEVLAHAMRAGVRQIAVIEAPAPSP